ncbi:LpxI family protein [Entomobacter blattae]|uniref:UDP-2,3-diacylglucosamine pyrophosphatase LpxI n=1 Tax=Entomobacter blattae TaxID=2762277 RepID=A0A7H1NSL6_9PROT|nr:UDP-2,3-diacylglucosamine diphosphatase LpxI [Entomobacter blattae]QNT78776.1 UDP-2,3-diacylglucosamine pyrophosphatase LpxI [Entomobacter blattae]
MNTPLNRMSFHNSAVGILAGGGVLPGQVAQKIIAQGRSVFIIAFEGFAEEAVIRPFPHAYVRLGAAGQLLSLLRQNHCQDIVLIGPVRRPSLLDLRPDKEGAKILARLGKAFFRGDDGLLAALVNILAEEGFHVRGAHEFLHESVGRLGVMGKIVPDEVALHDIELGIKVIHALGKLDIGQACVVQSGVVLAVEAMEGTDKMIIRAGECRQPRPGGVLVKLAKPGQERRADMPTIGPRTIDNVVKAGLRGVGFEPGSTLFTDMQACIDLADQQNIFLYGIDL